MKITAHIYEDFDGSDDPRAIQGGGGAGSRVIEVRHNSAWLIERYVSTLNYREGGGFSFKRVVS